MGTGEEIKGKESRKVKMSREKLGRWREGRQIDDDKRGLYGSLGIRKKKETSSTEANTNKAKSKVDAACVAFRLIIL